MHQDQEFYPRDDEIDLFQLFENLFQEKLLIIGVAILTGLIAVVASFILPKTFSAEAIINQAPMPQFASMNSVISLIAAPTGIQKTITSDRIYEDFRLQMTNYNTYRYAFDHSLLAKNAIEKTNNNPEAALARAYKQFHKKLKISFDKSRENTTKRITIRYESEHPEETARIINDFILPYTGQQVISGITTDRKTLIEQEQKHLEEAIRNLESSFLAKNQIQKLELEEAITQARAANIEDLMISESYPIVGESSQFLYGTRLLQARKTVINNRLRQYRYYSQPMPGDTEKPYLSAVQDKVFLLNQLARIDTNFSGIQPVIIEKKAEVPVLPDKPKKSLIVALGLIGGFMLGLFIALIRIAIRSRQERKTEFYRLANKA